MKNSWWLNLSRDIQSAFDTNDSKNMYAFIKQAFGPRQSAVSPLLSKDQSTLCKNNPTEILDRWTEHFSDLFYNPSVVDNDVINNLVQKDIRHEMSANQDEVQKCLKAINTGKAPGFDGIHIESLLYSGEKVFDHMYQIICDVWNRNPVPQDWVDAILVCLNKGKGSKTDCGNTMRY